MVHQQAVQDLGEVGRGQIMTEGKGQLRISEFWGDNRTEREFEESGLQCCTRTHELGHRCGYVALPKGHPLFGVNLLDLLDLDSEALDEVDVDGGVTFAKGTDDMWILGWDAAHCWHIPDPTIMDEWHRRTHEEHPEWSYYEQNSYMVDADMAEKETRSLARQLAAMWLPIKEGETGGTHQA